MNRSQALKSLLAWTADWQILLVGLLVPLYVFFADRLPLRVLALALLAIPCLWLLHWLARGRPFAPTPLDLPLLIWLITLPVGLWASALPEISWPILLREVVAVALFYAVVTSLNSAGKLRLASVALVAGTALLAVVGLLGTQRAVNLPLLPDGLMDLIPQPQLSFWNPESTGFNANLTGGLLALFVPVTVAYAWAASWPLRPRKLPLALVLWLLVAGETLVLILSQSRGAMLGFGVALAVVAIGRSDAVHRRRWAWLLSVGALAAILAIAVSGTPPALNLLLGGAADSAVSSAEGRLELFSRGLYMVQDFAFTGVGLGMFSHVLSLLYPLFLIGPDAEMAHVHNMYLQAGIDHGLPGMIAFLAMVLLLVVMGVQAVRLSRKRAWEPLAIGLLGGLAAYLVHGLVDVVSSSPRAHILIWAYWGLLAAVWRWAQAHQAEPGE